MRAILQTEDGFLTADLACALSIALYWGSAKTMLSLTHVLDYVQEGVCYCVNVISHLVFLVAIVILAARIHPWSTKPRIYALSSILLMLSGALLEISIASGSIALAVAANVLAGAGSAFALVLWGESLSKVATERYLLIILIGGALSILAQLACASLPLPILALAPCALLLASLFLSFQLASLEELHVRRRFRRIEAVMTDIPWRIFFACLVFSIPSSFIQVTAFGEKGSAALALELAILLTLIIITYVVGRLGVGFLPKAVTFVMAGSMAFVPLAYMGNASMISGVLASTGGLAFRGCLYADLGLISIKRDAPFSRVFAAGTAFIDLGTIVGYSVGNLTHLADGPALGVVLAVAYLIFLAGFLVLSKPSGAGVRSVTILPEPQSAPAESAAEPVSATALQPQTTLSESAVVPEVRIEQLATCYALTQRERDVMRLILQGKKTPSVAADLSLSVNTVKTHRRHLYQKLGCQSNEELFALVLEQ